LAPAVLLVLSHPLWAATIIVNETTCRLVDAVTAANDDAATSGCPAGSGADTLVLTANVGLTTPHVFAYSDDVGLPVITSEIVVEGGGFTIERGLAQTFRLMAVAPEGDLTLREVALRNGSTSDDGGAIYNAGKLQLESCSLSGNSAQDGGAITTVSPFITSPESRPSTTRQNSAAARSVSGAAR
jgi:hypothetical protein